VHRGQLIPGGSFGEVLEICLQKNQLFIIAVYDKLPVLLALLESRQETVLPHLTIDKRVPGAPHKKHEGAGAGAAADEAAKEQPACGAVHL
jgi:hypothetical protein